MAKLNCCLSRMRASVASICWGSPGLLPTFAWSPREAPFVLGPGELWLCCDLPCVVLCQKTLPICNLLSDYLDFSGISFPICSSPPSPFRVLRTQCGFPSGRVRVRLWFLGVISPGLDLGPPPHCSPIQRRRPHGPLFGARGRCWWPSLAVMLGGRRKPRRVSQGVVTPPLFCPLQGH